MKNPRRKATIKKFLEKLKEEILSYYYASPLTFSETRRQLYGLPIYKKDLSVKQLYNTIHRMRKQGWLEKKTVNDQQYYALTKTGKMKLLLYQLKKYSRQRSRMATIIIFDIPEEKRTYRNFLRNLLKQMDFTMIQKSAFIAPIVLPKEFFIIINELKLQKFIKIIEGEIKYYLTPNTHDL